MSEKLQNLLKKLLGEETFKIVKEKLDGEETFKIDVIQEGKESLFIPKARFDEVNTKAKDAQAAIDAAHEKSAKEVTDLTEKLKKLSESGGDVEEMKKQITELQTQVKEAGETAKAEIKKAKVRAHVRETLLAEQADPNYIDFLETKVNFEKIATSDDGNTHTGVAEQIPDIKKNLTAMFGTTKKKVTGTGHQEGDGKDLPEGILTMDRIKSMNAAEIQADQENVDKSLAHWADQKN